MLTAKAIDSAKPALKPYKLTDGGGLHLKVLPSGSKSWRYNYLLDSKAKTKTFGLYPSLTLAQARKSLVEFKVSLDNGIETSMPCFDELKREWYLHKLPMLKNVKTRKQIIHRIDSFASPTLGRMQIDAIRRVNLVAVVRHVQARGTIETAHRVAGLLKQIFDYAVDIGKLEVHYAIGLSRVLQSSKAVHFPCVALEDAGILLRAINAISKPITRIGLLLAAVTFTRTTELRFMRWSEIKDGKFWVIPEDRMKMGKPHVVPLSEFALKLLDEIAVFTGGYEFVLNSSVSENKPISEDALLDGLYSIGFKHKMCVHGFRALASTILNGEGFSKDAIERQLAHKETDDVRKAYNRAEYLTERVVIMDWYSNWVHEQLAD